MLMQLTFARELIRGRDTANVAVCRFSVCGCALKTEGRNFMANRTTNRTQQNEQACPCRTPHIVLTAGSIAAASLGGWALTRTAEPEAPEAVTEATSAAVTPELPAGSTAAEPSAPAPSTATAPPLQTPER